MYDKTHYNKKNKKLKKKKKLNYETHTKLTKIPVLKTLRVGYLFFWFFTLLPHSIFFFKRDEANKINSHQNVIDASSWNLAKKVTYWKT